MRFNYRELEKYFAESLPSVEVLAEALTKHSSEVEEIIPLGNDDWVIEVKILPNRASDAKTPLGLAREISVLLPDLKLKEPWPLANEKTARAKIIFSVKNINDLLGIDLTKGQIISFLNQVRVAVIEINLEAKLLSPRSLVSKSLLALVPSERLDLNIKEDLTDEVARLYGYNQIPSRILTVKIPIKREPTFDLANKVRAQLANEGYSEVYGYTFTDHGELTVEKPLASDKSYLRTNLSDGLEKIIRFNIQHLLFDTAEVKLFEIGSVFVDGKEEIHVAFGSSGKKLNLVRPGNIRETNLSDFQLKSSSNLDKFVNKNVNYKPVSSYPRIIRDVAVWAPENVQAETISEIIKQFAGELCAEGPILFDEFSKVGRKSLTFRLVFQSSAKTLSDDEANAQMNQVIKELEKQTGFEVRK